MKSENLDKFDKLFIKTMNLPASHDLSTIKYGQPPNWDSIRHVEMFIYLKRDFGVDFSAQEIVQLNTYLLLKEAFIAKVEKN